jgi:cystathionine beta-lyase/cystathionine gamma-synthase
MELKALFGCRLAGSREIALQCLHPPGSRTGLAVIPCEGAAAPIRDTGFFPACEAPEFAFLPRGAGAGPRGPAGDRRPDRRGDRRGAAVLGLSDRLMGRLAQRMRRRGVWLSMREAVPRRPFPANGEDPRGACGRVSTALCRLEGGVQAFLYPTGMSAITRALHLVRRPGRSQVIAVGHLFNDTYESLRLASRRPGEEPNVSLGVDELERLADSLTDQTAAILTETIANPLNDVPDLEVLARAAAARGVPLIVDNTIATPLLCRPLSRGADIVVHSTTKYLNGRNDHGGGAPVVKNPEHARGLQDLEARWNDAMSPREAAALERGLATLPPRVDRFNANARRVADFLSGRPAVGPLFFNGHPSHRSYSTAQRILAGPSSVISFTLARDGQEALRAFYDSPMPGIVKAPSLGSDQTLLCPYTMLTHYHDPDEVLASIGLPRYLVRVSVGCELDIEPVVADLGRALAARG